MNYLGLAQLQERSLQCEPKSNVLRENLPCLIGLFPEAFPLRDPMYLARLPTSEGELKELLFSVVFSSRVFARVSPRKARVLNDSWKYRRRRRRHDHQSPKCLQVAQVALKEEFLMNGIKRKDANRAIQKTQAGWGLRLACFSLVEFSSSYP